MTLLQLLLCVIHCYSCSFFSCQSLCKLHGYLAVAINTMLQTGTRLFAICRWSSNMSFSFLIGGSNGCMCCSWKGEHIKWPSPTIAISLHQLHHYLLHYNHSQKASSSNLPSSYPLHQNDTLPTLISLHTSHPWKLVFWHRGQGSRHSFHTK